MKNICKHCKWYELDEEKEGWCHLNPPTIVADEDDFWAVMPRVDHDQYCSHWESQEIVDNS